MTSASLLDVRRCAAVLVPVLALGAPARTRGEELSALTGVNVTTRNYDNQRTGANLSEKTLSVSNVNGSTFGKLFQVSVDDQVYAGILYASNLGSRAAR